jgi:AcrR family transcriptional regulator
MTLLKKSNTQQMPAPRETTRLAPATPEAEAVRQRILDECRRLFNEEGFASVTIARIADKIGMNEGRLHYYFNTKQQIVLALFEVFERSVVEAAARGLNATDRADRYADYQENWFMLMWRYRFFYRDQRGLHRVAPALQQRLARVYAEGQAQFRHVLDDMVALGLVVASPAELEQLVINTWVISSYWIDYITTSRGTALITRADLEGGMRQIDSLFAPYVTETGRMRRKGRVFGLD